MLSTAPDPRRNDVILATGGEDVILKDTTIDNGSSLVTLMEMVPMTGALKAKLEEKEQGTWKNTVWASQGEGMVGI